MKKVKDIEGLKKYFINSGHIFLYETSACMDLIFALAITDAVKVITVISLNMSRFLKRQYSSLFWLIGGYFLSR